LNETDLKWLAEVIDTLKVNDRLTVSVDGRGSFTVHSASIAMPTAPGCDFAIIGKRRQHQGETRSWRQCSYQLVKILAVEKRRLVVRDYYGHELEFAQGRPSGRSDAEPFDAERVA
jgi:hypothetical protein